MGDVELEILDGGAGAVSVAASRVQVVIGPAADGPMHPVATANPNTMLSVFKSGLLVHAAAMAIAAGGVVIACRSDASVDADTSAVTMARVDASTCVVTVTGDALDDTFVAVEVLASGTIGTAGIKFRVSLDAGRTPGTTLALGTANSYAIPDTGLTLHFAAGTLDKGDFAYFATTAPLSAAGDLEDAFAALRASQYAAAGWGSTHVLGIWEGADLATIQTYLDTLKGDAIFTRAMGSLRDASPAAKWGGTAEEETDWIDALATDVSALSATRICPTGGHYNMPGAFKTTVCGTPRYRRPLAWALAARQVAIPPQRHAGRVRDGALANVIVSPSRDPADGFVYHDERINPGLDEARITSAKTRKKPGFFINQPRLASPPGSVFTILPLGNVMDIGCSIVSQVGEEEINSDVRTNDNGTIFENEAKTLEGVMGGALKTNMTDRAMISKATVKVDRDTNVLADSAIDTDVTLFGRAYVLKERITIGFATPDNAGG